jgi:hypothetical protein
MKDKNCDYCFRSLTEKELERGGSYTCILCGFHYDHTSKQSAQEQAEDYSKSLDDFWSEE